MAQRRRQFGRRETRIERARPQFPGPRRHLPQRVPPAFRQQPVPVAGWPGTDSPARPRLLLPKTGRRRLRRICESWGSATLIEDAFEVREYDPKKTVKVGPLQLSFCPVPHYIETCAIEVRSKKGRRVTYGADCAPNEELVAFAHETDLLIIEATLPRAESTGPRGHLTPSEAGDHARRARARQVLLTHISDELDEQWALERAMESYGAALQIAAPGMILTL